MYNDNLIKQYQNEMGIGNNFSYAIKQQYIKWLENKVESAMCDAGSNAVLAEVRADIQKLESFQSNYALEENAYIRAIQDTVDIIDKKISEHFR